MKLSKQQTVAVLGVLCVLIILACRIPIINFYNYNFNGGDSYVVYGVQRLLSGQPLYQNPELPPYAVMQYTPLSYHLAAGCSRLLGITAGEVQAIYRVCRSLNLLENILSCFLIGMAIGATSAPRKNRWLYATPALIALTYHYYTRTDSLALFFFCAFMAFLVRHAQQGRAGHLIAAAGALVLCIFTKQSGVLCILIAGIYLLAQRKKFSTTVVFAVAALLFAGGAYLLFIAPHAALFYANAYKGLKNGYSFSFLVAAFTGQRYWDLMPLYVLLFVMVWKARGQALPYRTLVMAAAASWFFAIVTGFKIGSASNYFTEFIVLTCAAIPAFMQQQRANTFALFGRQFRYAGAAGGAFIILLLSKTTGTLSATFIEHYLKNLPEVYQQQQAFSQWLLQSGRLQPADQVALPAHDFMDHFLINYATLVTRDVLYQVHHGAPGTYQYAALGGAVPNSIKWVAAPLDLDSPFATLKDDAPFWKFDSTQYQPVADTLGWRLYQWVPSAGKP